jgi:hypothetical protein
VDRCRRRHVQEGRRQLREEDGRRRQALLLAKLRAADRDRHQGRFADQHLDFPQPGLAANMAAIGGLVPLGDKVRDQVKKNFAAGDSWADLGTYANKAGKKEFYGLFFNVNLKSLVWYIPENFKEKATKSRRRWKSCRI